MITCMTRRFALLLSAFLAVAAVPFMTPAWACGCGAYSPDKGGQASVPTETALVALGAGVEDVYLSLTVNSTTKSGALLFPVPDKKATVAAAPTNLFTDLEEVTRSPVDETGAPAGGAPQAGAPSVTVESRQQIGPLDVATLSSGDPAALTQWLQDNGFAAKPALSTAAKPYTDQGWAFVAVRLRPGAADQALHGMLDPLKIHFTTSEPVYPMRLSAMASEPETVRLYVLGEHRTSLNTTLSGLSATWAGPLGTDLAQRSHQDLAKVLGDGPAYLTRFDGRLRPAEITDDIHFAVAPSDQAVPPVQVRGGARKDSSNDAGIFIGIGVAAVLVAGLIWLTLGRRRNGSRPAG
jgi:hypothetical protein